VGVLYPVENSVPVELDVVLNHNATDMYVLFVISAEGSVTYPLPLNFAVVAVDPARCAPSEPTLVYVAVSVPPWIAERLDADAEDPASDSGQYDDGSPSSTPF
jgi:hypothetical protein